MKQVNDKKELVNVDLRALFFEEEICVIKKEK